MDSVTPPEVRSAPVYPTAPPEHAARQESRQRLRRRQRRPQESRRRNEPIAGKREAQACLQ